MRPAFQRKDFFSEEKKQKIFAIGRKGRGWRVRQNAEVFWFFFSKKNKPSLQTPHPANCTS
jgi:hypothetical protein